MRFPFGVALSLLVSGYRVAFFFTYENVTFSNERVAGIVLFF